MSYLSQLRSAHRCGLFTIFTCALAVISSAYGQDDWRPNEVAVRAAAEITDPNLRSHVRFLADDLLEGRGPGTRGDELAQLYIRCELESLGLQPGAGGNSWFQSVPLVGVSTVPPTSVKFKGQDGELTLDHYQDMMLFSGQAVNETVEVSGDLVFVGYGIQAPEFEWDDYKGMDVSGKILVMLNNDPEDDPELFAGKRRLYYGRWDYKYAMAAKMGAAGALIIHTTASAGYPYQVVQTSWSGEEFRLDDSGQPNTKVNGWLTEDAARRLMQLDGKQLDDLVASAQKRDFQPVPLSISSNFAIKAVSRQQTTGNVIGVIPGSDPELRSEYVVFTAHHDHLGLAAERDATGDNIYNGAVDNASGTAALLSIARAFASLETPPRRSLMFAFVGAEEQGLLGSKYLAENPPIPAGYMAAVLNIDGINFLGRTYDIGIVGDGKSNLDPIVKAVAGWQDRNVVPEVFPDRGYYYRSDQFSLAQIGVPGVYLDQGVHFRDRPDGWGKEQWEEWTRKDYHQPSDEYDDSWNLDGAVEDAQLLMHVGMVVANQDEMPQWLPGDEFEAARQAALDERQQQ